MILKHNRKITCFIIAIISALSISAQPPQFSIATDIGLQRSFKKEQQFYAFGHTVQVQFHLAEKDGVYFWLSYYTNGKFSNNVIATAKSPLTIPQQLPYQNRAVMSFRQFSVGWKKFLKGHYMIETGWNLYSYAGFGPFPANDILQAHFVPGRDLYIEAMNLASSPNETEITLFIKSATEPGTYLLNQPSAGFPSTAVSYGYYVKRNITPENEWITNAQYTGSVTITKIDTVNRFVSGTFQFNAINMYNSPVPLSVTEGRFDVKYD